MQLVRREQSAHGVRLAVEQGLAAELVAQDLVRVLREAVREFLKGLVEAGFEGVFVFFTAAGAGVGEVEVVVDASGRGDGGGIFGG